MGELKLSLSDGWLRARHNGEDLWLAERTPQLMAMVEMAAKRRYHSCNNPWEISIYVVAPPVITSDEALETYLEDVAKSTFEPGIVVLEGAFATGVEHRYYNSFPGEFIRVLTGEVFVVDTIADLCRAEGAVNVITTLSVPDGPIIRGEYLADELQMAREIEEMFS